MNADNDNGAATEDGAEPAIFIILGKAWKSAGGPMSGLHVMLGAPDDDSAVRRALEALQAEGFAEVELDKIGLLQEPPTEEPHASAWSDALNGEVAIISYDQPD